MSKIGAYDAKTKLPALLRQVRKGKRFTITHRGEAVAELVPSGAGAGESGAAAVDAMLQFERVAKVDPRDVAGWIAEGRR